MVFDLGHHFFPIFRQLKMKYWLFLDLEPTGLQTGTINTFPALLGLTPSDLAWNYYITISLGLLLANCRSGTQIPFLREPIPYNKSLSLSYWFCFSGKPWLI